MPKNKSDAEGGKTMTKLHEEKKKKEKEIREILLGACPKCEHSDGYGCCPEHSSIIKMKEAEFWEQAHADLAEKYEKLKSRDTREFVCGNCGYWIGIKVEDCPSCKTPQLESRKKLREETEETEESLLTAFECMGLCQPCWRKLLGCNNKPELAKRLLKWFRGEYADSSAAEKRIKKTLDKQVEKESTKGEEK